METYIVTYRDKVTNQHRCRIVTLDPTDEDINEFMGKFRNDNDVRVFLTKRELSPTRWG